MPSATCGLPGVMPSHGLVSIAGAYPVAPSLDRVGPMTRSARDCAMVLTAIAGYDRLDPYSLSMPAADYGAALSRPVFGMTIGILRSDLADVDPAIVAAIDACRAELAYAHHEDFNRDGARYGPALAMAVRTGQYITTADIIAASYARDGLCHAMNRLFTGIDALLLPVLLTPAPMVEHTMAAGAT